VSDHNLISKSEALFRLRNASNKIGLAVNTLREEDDWQAAHDLAYEAQDMLFAILDHLEEAANAKPTKTKANERTTPWKPPAPDPEPPGSLKYGVPPGTPGLKERSGRGAMGYQGNSRHPHNYSSSRTPPPVIKVEKVVDAEPRRVFQMPPSSPEPIEMVDTKPPEPIIIPPPPPPPPSFKVGDYAQHVINGAEQLAEPLQIYRVGDGFAFFASLSHPLPVSQLVSKSAPALPEGAEVVTFDIDRLMTGLLNVEMMAKLDELPEAFRKKMLMTHALTHRPVTVWRVGESEWRIR